MEKWKNNGSQYLLISTLAILICTVTSHPLKAHGLLPYGMGTKMLQMGGAGVAIPLDSTSGNVNPALMANVGRDIAFDPVIAFQKEHVDTSRTLLTAGTPLPPYAGPITNRIKAYVGGYLGFNYPINPEWSVGISTAGGANNAKYERSIISPALTAPSKLVTSAGISSQILAYKPSCNESYGVSLIVAHLMIKNNLTQFPSGIVTRGNNRTDNAWGLGGRFGGQWNIGQYVSMGVAASTPLYFQKLKKYNDVLRYRPQLPPIITGGFAIHPTKCTDVLFDIEGLFWRDNPFTGKNPPAGQGWRNALVLKFGIQHKVLQDLTVRLGYNYGRTPIKNKYVLFNALNEVITVCENVLTTGLTYNFTPKMSFDFGGSIMFKNKLTDNGNGPAGLAARGLTVDARAWTINLGFNLKY